MKATQPREVKIEMTGHAIYRMRERACNLEDVRSYLLGMGNIPFLENHQGFEITIPYKGRLVGDFDKNGAFIGKSFLPQRFGRDYGRKPKDAHAFKVASVLVPRFNIISLGMIERSRGVNFAL